MVMPFSSHTIITTLLLLCRLMTSAEYADMVMTFSHTVIGGCILSTNI